MPGAVNKLLKFVKEQKAQAAAAVSQQSAIMEHFNKEKPKEIVVPYSDALLNK